MARPGGGRAHRRWLSLLLVALLVSLTPAVAAVHGRAGGPDVSPTQLAVEGASGSGGVAHPGDALILNITIVNGGDDNATNVSVLAQAVDPQSPATLLTLYDQNLSTGIPYPGSGEAALAHLEVVLDTGGLEPNASGLLEVRIHATTDGDTDAANDLLSQMLAFQPVPTPELELRDLTIGGPVPLRQGDQAIVAANLSNSGTSAATDVLVNVTVDGTVVANDTVAVSIDQTIGLSFTVDTAGLTPGVHAVEVTLQPDFDAAVSAQMVLQEPYAGDPDLYVSQLALSPDVARTNTTVWVAALVANGGLTDSSAVNATLRDHLGATLVQWAVPPLAAQDETLLQASIALTNASHGQVSWTLHVDPEAASRDSNRTNNSLSADLMVEALPELTVPSLEVLTRVGNTTAPIDPIPTDEDLLVRITVANTGPVPAPAGASLTLDLGGVRVAATTVEESLAPDTWTTIDVGLDLTDVPGLSPGSANLTATIDATEVVDELDESNNTVTVVLVIVSAVPKVSLLPADLTLHPDPAPLGAAVRITATVHNEGNETAPEVDVRLRLLPAPGASAPAPTLLQSWSITLGAQSAQGLTWEGVLPSTFAGSHQLELSVDPSDRVAEANETDNVQRIPIFLLDTPSADEVTPSLVVQAMRTDGSPVEGELHGLYLDITNEGTGYQQAGQVIFEVDGSEQARLDLAGIASGATRELHVPWSPDAGDHTIVLRVGSQRIQFDIERTGATSEELAVHVEEAHHGPTVESAPPSVSALGGLAILALILMIMVLSRRRHD